MFGMYLPLGRAVAVPLSFTSGSDSLEARSDPLAPPYIKTYDQIYQCVILDKSTERMTERYLS